jgi:hypothetical protein
LKQQTTDAEPGQKHQKEKKSDVEQRERKQLSELIALLVLRGFSQSVKRGAFSAQWRRL